MTFSKQTKSFFLFPISLTIFLNIFYSNFLATSAYAESDRNLDDLFKIKVAPPSQKAPHTFVFFVNGSGDHYVPPSFLEVKSKWGRADAHDVEEIKKLAVTCESCNVLILNTQRGGAHWYTSPHKTATYLRGYSAGKKLFSNHVNILNSAQPGVVSQLLKTAENFFPGTDIHFFYRGHGFYPSYNPNKNADIIAPFDSNFRKSAYGIEYFVEGLKNANLKQPLTSIVFAACSMSYIDIASQLAPFAHYMIASQIDVIETLRFGFDYDFFRDIPFESSGERTIPLKIASSLMEHFQTRPQMLDNKMEEPVTLIDLKQIATLNDQLWRLLGRVQRENDKLFESNWTELLEKTHVAKSISNRYFASLIHNGKSEKEARDFALKLKDPAHLPEELDVLGFIRWLEKKNLRKETVQELRTLEEKISNQIEVYNKSDFAEHTGLSFDANPIKEAFSIKK